MATESPIRIVEGTERWRNLKQSTRYEPPSSRIAIDSLGLFLKDQRYQSFEKDVIPSRSGSAPPNMEGSVAAIENLFSLRKSVYPGSVLPSISTINHETGLQRHADISPYHATDANVDRRFGGPLNSLESHLDIQPSVSSGNRKLPRNSLPAHEEESEDDQSSEQSGYASVDKASLLGYNSRSSDSMQGDSYHSSSPSHRSLSYQSTEETFVTGASSGILHNMSVSTSSADTNNPCLVDKRQILPPDGNLGIVVGEPLQERFLNAVEVETPDNVSVTRAGDIETTHVEAVKSVNIYCASNSETQKFHEKEHHIPHNNVLHQQVAPQECGTSRIQGCYSQIVYPGTSHAYGSLNQFHYGPSSVSAAEVQPIHQSSGIAPPLYATAAAFMTSANPFYPSLSPAGFFGPQYSMGVYNYNSAVLPSYLAGYPHQGALPLAFGGASFPTSGVSNGGSVHAYDPQNLLKFNGQVGVPLHMHYIQPPVHGTYVPYSHFDRQKHSDGATANQVNYCDPKKGPELVGLSNNYTPQHLAGTSYNNLNIRRGNMSSHYYLGSPAGGGPSMHFPAAGPVVQSKPGGGTRIPGGRYNMSPYPSSSGNPIQTNGQNQNWNNLTSLAFLEELKSGKGQRFELSDIAGYIVEFSVDQHGSRFIQQKLEACNLEEKAFVFDEVVPHASRLITDVFGNYVVQKLFEYGSPDQRKYLATQLEGQILHLSFQMYGCRVIQKALEVIDLEQKARLVKELDGHIIKCVRDQNGNHVIQKCIESIPTDKIQFILSSFHGQVASLSMHPYGCRVIQRILERCNDDIQTQFIVDEILDSVCSLAQDQYGNYVTQHVLERGKPLERSKIVQKLAGSIVQLSQHKFASNVVEKCLEYSDPTTRGMLIKEIIGHGDKNDNLLIMMKDQYANYVIQKILEKCSSDQRAVLLGLIRNHLPVLKKYTYGKHIVARFEQLYGEELGCDCPSPKIEQSETRRSGS